MGEQKANLIHHDSCELVGFNCQLSYDLKSPRKRPRERLFRSGWQVACLWEIILIPLVDVERAAVWEASFPKQDILNCVRVETAR